jgi:hypothetical protein
MKTEKVFSVIGKKLEKEYRKLGFRYSKKEMYLKKTTKKYVYHIFFSRFFNDTPDKYTELHVILMADDKLLLGTHLKSEVFYLDLWKMGIHYIIADETLINEVFIDLNKKIKEYLLPQIKKLENSGSEERPTDN